MKKSLIWFAALFAIVGHSCKKVNCPAAPKTMDQVFFIDENSETGTLVGQVLAFDEEDSKPLTYSLVSGNENDAFSISEDDGLLTIQNEDAIDFETNPVFNLIVEVRNSADKSTQTNVTVNLNNIDIPTNGMILYYPFDGDVMDYSDSQNNGIDFTDGNYVQGMRSEALNFNGSTDYIELENTLNSINGLSFSFWMYSRGSDGIENNGTIVAKYNMSNGGSRCFMLNSFGNTDETRTDNNISITFYKYGYTYAYHDKLKSYMEQADIQNELNPATYDLVNPLRIELQQWTHCLINVTETSIECWLDGVLCTKKQREYSNYFSDETEPVYIGNIISGGAGSNNHFNGILDELRVYNRGLTEDEIKTLYKE
ncbi:LamG-like jellyroll fold domain-containing protein [Mangrovibacterium diazotrophicum]|uniref:Cadherin domain-containing protein n=1 Tax=Mangrovibacterium diazotrophicum TaxID=1261403 RepID=A0A419VX08_9BACT|nr:LamG-like jellyroll fold domain-containing protein [Mangrovibacterium diazotrophicum]RKD87694.1 cadherin domain-containing protein [Mangrovibacterium diazotrophicum]